MDVPALLLEIYGRIPPLAEQAVDGLTADQLATAPAPGANTIGWLVWHLTRVQDHHVAELMGTDQIWTTGDWAARCALDPDPDNTGYGHNPEQVLSVRPETPDVLLGYLAAVDAADVRHARRARRPTTSTAWSTAGGTHRSPWASASSASPTTACSTSVRPRTCAGS